MFRAEGGRADERFISHSHVWCFIFVPSRRHNLTAENLLEVQQDF
jgi:hypothetical protein